MSATLATMDFTGMSAAEKQILVFSFYRDAELEAPAYCSISLAI